MPLFWWALPHEVSQQQRVEVASTMQLAEELKVEYRKFQYDAETDTFTFRDGVVARLGVTKVEADTLIVARRDRKGSAKGLVKITDPEGHVSASDVEFDLDAKGRLASARGSNLVADLAGVRLSAKSAKISPKTWEFREVSFTNCKLTDPVYEIQTAHLRLTPGRTGRAQAPRIKLFGATLMNLPTQTFLLDPRVQGLKFPSLAYRKDDGIGVQWDSSVLLNEQGALSASASSFPRNLPSFGLRYSVSMLPYSELAGLIAPRNELRERFTNGYMDSVGVKTTTEEHGTLTERRHVWSVGSDWNQRVAGREVEPFVNKPLEFTWENGGRVGKRTVPGFEPGETNMGYLGQVRLQSIQEVRGEEKVRGTVSGSLKLPTYVITPGVETLARVDASGFAGTTTFGWARSQFGISLRPVKEVTLSGAWVESTSFGTPQFDFDKLYATGGFHVRSDFDLGPTQLSFLWKWDRHRHWYDREYLVSQVVGCVEPYVLYRQFPGDYRIGLTFRLQDFQSMLRRREMKRSTTEAPLPHKRTIF